MGCCCTREVLSRSLPGSLPDTLYAVRTLSAVGSSLGGREPLFVFGIEGCCLYSLAATDRGIFWCVVKQISA